jgi:hypothetical protein
LPRHRPIDTIAPTDLLRAVRVAHTRAALTGGGTFDAGRLADLAGVRAAEVRALLGALAALGHVTATWTGDSAVYAAGGLAEHQAPAGCRPAGGLRPRELWAALARLLADGHVAATGEIAGELDVPVGRVDRTWLQLRLAGLVGAGLLRLQGDLRWRLTATGEFRVRHLADGSVSVVDVWAAIAADRPRVGDVVDAEMVARRLGVRLERLGVWLHQAMVDGEIRLLDGSGIVPTSIGRRRLAAVPGR